MSYGKCLVRMYVLQVRGPKTREWPRGIERLGEHAIRGDDDVSQRVEQDGNDDGGGDDLRVEHLDWSGLEADGGGGKELLVQGEVLGG